jgi:uncharacterized protein YjcR
VSAPLPVLRSLSRLQYSEARRRWIAGERDSLAADLGLKPKTLQVWAKRQGWPRRTHNRAGR